MSRFSDLYTIRVKYFHSWKNEFIEEYRKEYNKVFFRNFQINKYLNGLFYRLKILSDNFSLKRVSSYLFFLQFYAYFYKFSVENFLFQCFDYQYICYDFFFSNNVPVNLNKNGHFYSYINFFHFDGWTNNICMQSLFSKKKFLYSYLYILFFPFFFQNQNNVDFKINSKNTDTELFQKIISDIRRSADSDRLDQYKKTYKFGKKPIYGGKRKKTFSLKLNYRIKKLYYEKIYFLLRSFNLFYESLIFNSSKKKKFHFLDFQLCVLLFSKLYYKFFSYFFSFIVLKDFFFKFKKVFFLGIRFLTSKISFLCTFFLFYTHLKEIKSSFSTNYLFQNFKNEELIERIFEEKNYYNYFLFFFIYFFLFSVERSISFFMNSICLVNSFFFFSKGMPPITSAKIVSDYISFELEKGISIYKVFKNIQFFQLKEKRRLSRALYYILANKVKGISRKQKGTFRSKKLRNIQSILRKQKNEKRVFYNTIYANINRVISSQFVGSKFPLSGIRVECKGSTKKGKQSSLIAYHHVVKNYRLVGRMPYSTIGADVDFSQTFARTKSGVIGIKVWVFFNTFQNKIK
uniref:40S ribosomal protein S3 n=1 Tax=Pleurostomum flabellatum TaxID=405751 RepID=A0A7T0M403_9EUKA|nr:40S ribosomal protein S3 [Pleurostomum flabellatum]QPL15593.1 40S ribosomal protein S3 [Pleurostomum flabellatum]